MNGGLMKLKNILYRNFDNLNEVEHQFYDDNRDKYELNVCDKYNLSLIHI